MIKSWFSLRRDVTPVIAAPESERPPSPGPSRQLPPQPRSRLADILHIFVLANFALAQPIYDRLGERPTFLVDQHIGLTVICLFIFTLSVVVPTCIALCESLVLHFFPKFYENCHGIFTSIFLLLLMLPIAKQIPFLSGPFVLIIAMTATVLGVRSYFRYPTLRMIVSVAAPGILIFPVVFLCHSPVVKTNSGVSASRGEKFQPVPVVLLVCDEFCGSSLMTPTREIDANRFPNFAALARDGTWFRNATTVNSGTEQALPAILSGRYPTTIYPPVRNELPQNLFRILRLTGGYELSVFEPVSRIAPSNLSPSVEKSGELWKQSKTLANVLWRIYLFHLTPFDYLRRLPEVPAAWFGLTQDGVIDGEATRGIFRYNWGAQRNAQFQHFLRTIDGAPTPTLHFMHVLLPHLPWCFLPSGRRYSEDGEDWQLLDDEVEESDENSLSQDELNITHKQQRYLLQVMYLDRLLGQLIARLREQGLYDRCLLIVTADHGISFRPGTARRHFETGNQDEILSVPLFIKRPGQSQGGISDRTVESVDIFPTIADVVGITLHNPTDGWSVFDSSTAERTYKTIGGYQKLAKIDPAIITKSRVPRDLQLRFGESSHPESLFSVGPIPELVGRRVESLPQSNVSRVKLEFRRFGDMANSDPSEILPCYFEGRVCSPLPTSEPIVLAVSVNGIIRGVTRTYRPQKFRDQWTVLIPENSFHAGKNDVRFYSVTGSSSNWELSPCETSQLANPESD